MPARSAPVSNPSLFDRRNGNPFRWFFAVYLCLYALTLFYLWVACAVPVRASFVTLGLTNKYDLLCFVERYRDFRHPGFYSLQGQPFNYPAFAAVALRPLYGTTIPSETCYLMLFTVSGLLMCCLFVGAMVRRNMSASAATALAASAMFSFPVLLMFYLNNAELLVWITLTVGVWGFCRKYFWTAAICFGLAAALKYFPVLLLVLLVRKGQWQKALAGVVTALFVSLASLAILGPSPSAAYLGLKAQLPRFTAYYLQSWHFSEGAIDHSLYGFVKLLAVRSGHQVMLHWTLPVYLALVFLVVSLLYLSRIRKQPALNQLLACMTICVWLSPMSADYTLVNMIPVMGALAMYAWENHDPADAKLLVPAFVCFAFLLAPFYFLTVGGWPYNGPVRSIVLAVLLIFTLRYSLSGDGFVSREL